MPAPDGHAPLGIARGNGLFFYNKFALIAADGRLRNAANITSGRDGECSPHKEGGGLEGDREVGLGRGL
jgi:hypothetical protein